MARAIFITGSGRNEGAFLTDNHLLANFLRTESKMCDIVPLLAREFDSGDSFAHALQEALWADDPLEPTLVVFNGHGAERAIDGQVVERGIGWRIGKFAPYRKDAKPVLFPYDLLAEVLEMYPGPLLLINNCCFAFAAVRALARHIPLSSQFGLIASSGAEEKSYTDGTMFGSIIRCWRKREVPFVDTPAVNNISHFKRLEPSVIGHEGAFAGITEASIEERPGHSLEIESEVIESDARDYLYTRYPRVKRWRRMLDYHFFPPFVVAR